MDKKYIKFQSKRLELIKIINTLYSVNPIILFDKIKNLEDDYKKKAYQEKKPKNTEFKNLLYAENNIDKTPNDDKSVNSSISKNNNNEKLNSLKKIISNENKKTNVDTNNNEKEENQNATNNEEDDENSPMLMKNYTLSPSLFQKIINSYKLILIYLFGSYFLYCIIFFIYVMLGLGRLTHAISYCEVNSKIDELVYDNLNSLVYLYLTNSTTKDYNRIIYGNSTHDYLEIAINSLYSSIQEKENIEYSYKYLFPPLNEIITLNCSEQYIEDEEFMEACQSLNISYEEFVKSLCEVFPVAKTNSDINILNEILYMTEGFYRVFKTGEFTEIFINYIQDPILCQCFTLMLTFNKMIRAYFNDVIFPKQVYSIFDYFTGLIVAYLVISVIFEIVFFVVLNVAILQKIKYNNELLLDFIDSLKF
jgi:hypothetical protein